MVTFFDETLPDRIARLNAMFLCILSKFNFLILVYAVMLLDLFGEPGVKLLRFNYTNNITHWNILVHTHHCLVVE